jgi:hypothetical protein
MRAQAQRIASNEEGILAALGMTDKRTENV